MQPNFNMRIIKKNVYRVDYYHFSFENWINWNWVACVAFVLRLAIRYILIGLLFTSCTIFFSSFAEWRLRFTENTTDQVKLNHHFIETRAEITYKLNRFLIIGFSLNFLVGILCFVCWIFVISREKNNLIILRNI